MIADKIICLSGGFDPLHVGHLKMIKEAAGVGRVIIILNSDLWLDRKKGYHLMNWDDRAEILRSMKYVDSVVPVDDSNGGTVNEALDRIRPDYFGNGGDRTAYNTPEMKLCDALGIKMIWGLGGTTKTQSSSVLVDSVVNAILKKLEK